MRILRNVASRAALIFLFAGTVWILLTDRILKWFAIKENLSIHTITYLQDSKGFFFVIVSALILFAVIHKATKKLERNKREYSNLFRNNPAPMFIYDTHNGHFIAINDACCRQYGYTYRQMKSLHIDQIRATHDDLLGHDHQAGLRDIGLHRHRKCDGTEFWIHKFARDIVFEHRAARVVLVIDVNEEVLAKERLERKNKQLEEIAWFESHKLRAPVARILGLLNIIEQNKSRETEHQVIKLLRYSSEELDLMVRHLSHKTIHELNNTSGAA